MERSITGVMYYYLPGSYLTNKSSIARVTRWNPYVGTNVKNEATVREEVLYKINNATHLDPSYRSLTEEDMILVSPGSVEFEPSPLTFYCKRCGWMAQYSSADHYVRVRGQDCKNKRCRRKGTMLQMAHVFVHGCGQIEDVELERCKCKERPVMHLRKGDLQDLRTWYFQCPKCSTTKLFGQKACLCGGDATINRDSAMSIKPCTSGGIIVPASHTVVSYGEEEKVGLLNVHLAHQMGFLPNEIDPTEYSKRVEDSESLESDKKTLEDMGLSEDMIAEFLKRKKADISKIDKKLVDHFGNRVIEPPVIEDIIYRAGREAADYYIIRHDKNTRSLQDTKEIFEKEVTKGTKKPREVEQIKKSIDTLPDYGIKNVFLVEDLQLVDTVYGYIVGTYDETQGDLQLFQESENRCHVYINPNETEGLLFELDRKEIIDWLHRTGHEQDSQVLEWAHNSKEARSYIVDRVLDHLLGTQKNFGTSQNRTTGEKIVELVHSMSHSLMKKATIFCGIGSDSIGEILFPEIPAFVIYNKNKSKLGGMYTLFETSVPEWLSHSKDQVENCTYDPICINEQKSACHSCLFVSEISCTNFNKNLDRKTLTHRDGLWAGNAYD